MANAHGLFPKIDRWELDDEFNARLDVWLAKAYEPDPRKKDGLKTI